MCSDIKLFIYVLAVCFYFFEPAVLPVFGSCSCVAFSLDFMFYFFLLGKYNSLLICSWLVKCCNNASFISTHWWIHWELLGWQIMERYLGSVKAPVCWALLLEGQSDNLKGPKSDKKQNNCEHRQKKTVTQRLQRDRARTARTKKDTKQLQRHREQPQGLAWLLMRFTKQLQRAATNDTAVSTDSSCRTFSVTKSSFNCVSCPIWSCFLADLLNKKNTAFRNTSYSSLLPRFWTSHSTIFLLGFLFTQFSKVHPLLQNWPLSLPTPKILNFFKPVNASTCIKTGWCSGSRWINIHNMVNTPSLWLEYTEL